MSIKEVFSRIARHIFLKRLSTAVMLLFAFGVNAQDVTRQEAVRVAEKWIQLNGHSQYQIHRVVNQYYQGHLVIYLVQLKPKGFILLAADKDVVPVLGYSFEDDASERVESPEARYWLDGYSQQILDAINQGAVYEVNRNKWEDLLSNRHNLRSRPQSVSPLLATRWGQNAGWNDYCPTDPQGPGGHAYAGCVAVAMAQIMKKWDFPAHGAETHGYTSDNYGYISADFGNTTYEWVNMSNTVPDQYNTLLLYHCGVSVDMNYGPDESGAYTRDVRDALVRYFNYSIDARLIYKYNFFTRDWIYILKADLNQGYPIIYRGQGTEGHMFVCDGYQNTNYFHFNWGWSGDYNGYYYLDDLTPGSNNYNYYQAAIIGIHPNNGPHPENDRCEEAIPLNIGRVCDPIVVTNVGATNSGAENPECANYQGGDVWFRITPTISNTLIIETSAVDGSDESNTGMAIYTGDCQHLHRISCNDNRPIDDFSGIQIDFPDINTTYYIRVWDYGNVHNDEFKICAYQPHVAEDWPTSVDFTIHPNPTKGTIVWQANGKVDRIQALNLSGQILMDILQPQHNRLDVSRLPRGVYLLRVFIGNKTGTFRLIKD